MKTRNENLRIRPQTVAMEDLIPSRHWVGVLILLCAIVAIIVFPILSGRQPQQMTHARPVPQSTPQPQPVVHVAKVQHPVKAWHPRHVVKIWVAYFHGSRYRVTQLPRCEHLETCFTYDTSGETIAHAKAKMGGIAGLSGSFHNPHSMALADFFQTRGSILSPARTKRYLLYIDVNGRVGITGNHMRYKGVPGVSALALGQRLVPLEYDGFSSAFMNRVTDRMAIGMNENYIYIIQGNSTVWRLASFIRWRLPCTIAINSDGGHVVRGKAPVHIIFRWRKQPQ